MLSLKLKTDYGEARDLVGIHITIAEQKRQGCKAIGCIDGIVKRYNFDREYLQTSKLLITYQSKNSEKDIQCIETVVNQIQEFLDPSLRKPRGSSIFDSDSYSKKSEESGNHNTSIVHRISVSVDDKEKSIIDNVQDLFSVNINIAVRQGGQSVIAIGQAYKEYDKEPVLWLKEELDKGCSFEIDIEP